MLKTYSVEINGKHFFDDFGLVMTEKDISAPEAQTKYIEVPGRNGFIDMSEVLTGNVRYKDRTIKCRFYSKKHVKDWSAFISSLQNAFQGVRCKIIFDDDLAFYWLGRVSIELETSGRTAYVNLTAIVEPYKYNIMTSADDWLWDPFDFENGYINDSANIVVNGSTELSLMCQKRWENPIIISDSNMSVVFNGKTYPIKTGSQVMYEIILTEGINTMTFKGNGTVTVVYVGGSL